MPIIIVGASSGGIDAVSRLIKPLPLDFPAPIIVAQHLDPSRPSSLVGILAHHTKLPVRQVEDHAELERGVVYVIPSNRLVDFADSNIRVRASEASRGTPSPSIDVLLESAAHAYGDQVIAIILTGAGSDGTSGAHHVKAHEGTVIIQDPRTAEYPSMPRSLAPTTVDFIRDLDEMGELLTELVGDGLPAPPEEFISGDGVEELLEYLRSESSIDFSQYKTPTIMRRLQRRLVATNCSTLEKYQGYLRKNQNEYFQLVNSFLIKVTEFFRDPELFEYLEETVIPELIDNGRQRGNQLRIWSAGCATGEEAYSLAITIAEALGDEVNRFAVRIFATDIDESAVNFARRGVYPAAALKEVSEELVDRYFSSIDGEYEISKLVRSMVVFGQHDLAQRSPFPSIDLILCRNVLIYFTGDLQRRALQLFAYSLRNGGRLVLGKSESTSPLSEYFAVEDNRLKVYRRQGEPTPVPVGPVDTTTFSVPRLAPSTPWQSHSNLQAGRTVRDAISGRGASDRSERLLFHLPVGIVLIDRNYDIRTLNNTARHYLGIHGQAVGEDLLHLIRTMPLETLRDAIDQSFRRSEVVHVEGEWEIETVSGNRAVIEILCQRQDGDADGQDGNTVVVVLTDITDRVQERREIVESRERTNQQNQQLNDRVSQLFRINQQLVDSNRELAEANEDLRSTNEQLLVSSEEAQASAEEVETLNEELQTTNEELETLNEELQATVEELNATNEDMQTRTVELQEMTDSLDEQRRASEAQRARLEAVLGSMADAVVVVDSSGNITLMNPERCHQMFGENLQYLIAEDEQGHPLEWSHAPLVRARSGNAFTMEFAVEFSSVGRRWYEASARPILGDNETSGSVLVIRDVTDSSLRRLQEEFMAVAGHELRTPLTALRGYLGMVQGQLGTSDERLQRRVAIALSMVDRLVRLVSDLLDVGRLQSGKFELTLESVDLGSLVQETVQLGQSMTTEHTIEIDPPDSLLPISADPMRIQQVLLNLLSNAIAYSPDESRIDVRLRQAGAEMILEVQDYGIGIPEEARTQIFGRFFQGTRVGRRTNRGLGLGLFITREIVNAHGGRIEVDSADGEGTTFRVFLPREAEQEPSG